ncbi:MAG: hypothetical protein JKX96_07750 [Acinetobacter sp.]|nr:hypothetical protein [Acinetobacter sp.]
MTLASTASKEIKLGNGSTTVFSFTFVINAADDLVVIHTDVNGLETTITEGTGTANYSISVANYPGNGTVTYPATLGTELATGEKLTLARVVALDQETDLQNQAQYKPETVEATFDYSRMIDLQQQDQISRSIIAPISTVLASNIITGTIDATVRALTITSAGPASSELSVFPGDLDVVLTGVAAGHFLRYNGNEFVNVSEIVADDLATDSVTTIKIQDNAVTLAKMAGGVDGNLITYDSSGDPAFVVTGTASQVLTSNGAGAAPTFNTVKLPLSYKSGFIMSNGTDTDHDIDTTIGSCRNSTNASNIAVSAITKRIDASWVTGTGNGGLSSSLTVSNATWYHVFAVTVGGVDDILFDTSVTCANGVSDHTVTAFRRIGSVLTDGSANILAFTQLGDLIYWTVPPRDLNASVTTSTTTATLSTPLGINVTAILNGYQTGAGTLGYLFPTFVTASTPSASASPLANMEGTNGSQVEVTTDNSSQINARTSNAGGETVQIVTIGWREIV